jgi:hypothetical protein
MTDVYRITAYESRERRDEEMTRTSESTLDNGERRTMSARTIYHTVILNNVFLLHYCRICLSTVSL